MSRSLRTAVVVLAVVLFLNLIGTGYLFLSVSSVNDRVDAVEENSSVVSDQLLHAGQLAGNGSSTGAPAVGAVEKRHGYFVAYDAAIGEGVVFEYEYQPLPGDRTFIDTSGVVIESTFQQSLQKASEAVEETKYSPATTGYALSLETPEAWDYIEGESAGLAMAAQIAGMDPGYERNSSVALTGQVEPDGSVVGVDHVTAKAVAAEEQGKDVLVAPYTYGNVDVNGIDVVYVQTVEEGLSHALDPVNESRR